MSSTNGLRKKRRPMQRSYRSVVPLIALAGVFPLAGCGHAPSFNILGSFFPAWLICMILGIAFAASVSWLLTAWKRENLISWGILVYPCLAASFACTLWLLFFS